MIMYQIAYKPRLLPGAAAGVPTVSGCPGPGCPPRSAPGIPGAGARLSMSCCIPAVLTPTARRPASGASVSCTLPFSYAHSS